jgi:hypothetical protein
MRSSSPKKAILPPLASAAPISVEGGGNTVVINQVRAVVGEIELELASADCSDSGQGQPFSFRSALEAEIEAEVNRPAVASAAEPLNLTVSADAAPWFMGPGGTVLDPSSPANPFAIGQDIRLSFAAFEDDDRDGIEDRW